MNICILPGDGIGPEVMKSAVEVLKKLDSDIRFSYGDIGFASFKKSGESLPQKTIDLVKSCDAALFGAVTTPPDIKNYRSPILGLRKYFDLYVNLRPCISIPHESSRQGIDITIVRENTEGLYSGIERLQNNGTRAVTERIITKKGSQRILRYAFDLAKKNKKKITVVHKANVLRETCGLFLRTARDIAKEYDVIWEDMLVDRAAMELIRKPEQFEIIVTTNLFGDILSDEASMLVGGLGAACSGNIGKNASVFEPVHGSAPDIAGKGIANPIAAILAAKMMLEYLGNDDYSRRIENAITKCIKENNVTRDMKGSLSTIDFTSKVVSYL